MIKNLKKLCNEYGLCDSVSKKSDLQEAIISLIREYLDTIYSNISSVLDTMSDTIFDMSEYIPGKGTITIYEIYDDKVSLNYYDHWGYGGSCSEVFHIKFEDHEKFDKIRHLKQLKEQKKTSIEFKIKSLENVITSLKTQLRLL